MAFAETFKALSDPVRREILHLKILKKADLVWETKVKNFVYYELNTTVVEELLLGLSDLKGGKNDER